MSQESVPEEPAGEEPTLEELSRAVGAFLIVLGKLLPPNLTLRMSQELNLLADQIEENGEPTTGRLARDFAKALAMYPGEGLTRSH